jgi:hypothetical protein
VDSSFGRGPESEGKKLQERTGKWGKLSKLISKKGEQG